MLMPLDYETLKLVWWVLVGVLLIGFAVTDGFDMGAGTLLPFVGKTDAERRVVINAVGPHWDGNQVWFITAGGAIFAAWPAVYAAAFSGFYLAMLLVLFALFFRPVGFDYRSKIEDPRWRNAWDWGLFIGGTIPPIVFGVAIGNLLQGVPFHYDNLLRPEYTGSLWGLLFNPFALLVGIVSLAMLTMHGAIYVQMRTEGAVRQRLRAAASGFSLLYIATFALAGMIVSFSWFGTQGYEIVSMPPTDALPNPTAKEVVTGTGLLHNFEHYPAMWIAPLLGFAGALGVLLFARVNLPGWGFIFSMLTQAGTILTAGFAMFPFVMASKTMPSHSLTVWDSPSSHLTLTVMFWAAVIFIPIILLYTLWCYRSLWGKVTVEQIEANTHSAY